MRDMDGPEVVHALFDAFARRDAAALERYVAPECRFWPQGTAEAVGRTEPYVGHAGMAQFIEDASSAWEALELRPTDVRSAGTGVVCFGVAIGRLRGASEDARIPVIWVFRLSEGRVVFGRAVATAAEARELVGPDAASA